MPKTSYDTFLQHIKNEDKEQAVLYALSLIEEGHISIESLYLDYLARVLIEFSCDIEDEDICIWKEHFRTSIIRTILESSYRYILDETKDKEKVNQHIVVLTPPFEYHEIGAIMSTHFLMLEGFKATYIGANTPKQDILSAIRAYQPEYVALSVTNPYNIVITKQITDEIKRFFPEVKIILGGQAFANPNVKNALTYDYVLHSIDDIKAFKKEVTS